MKISKATLLGLARNIKAIKYTSAIIFASTMVVITDTWHSVWFFQEYMFFTVSWFGVLTLLEDGLRWFYYVFEWVRRVPKISRLSPTTRFLGYKYITALIFNGFGLYDDIQTEPWPLYHSCAGETPYSYDECVFDWGEFLPIFSFMFIFGFASCLGVITFLEDILRLLYRLLKWAYRTLAAVLRAQHD